MRCNIYARDGVRESGNAILVDMSEQGPIYRIYKVNVDKNGDVLVI